MSENSTLLKIARDIIAKGPEKGLPNVPIEQVGKWSSADQSEIEGVRGVVRAMQNHRSQRTHARPLSVAVFGPPGAGKSFIVKQMADKVDIDERDILTFNLSQFNDLDDLEHAFTLVRDKHLSGKFPVVFWDEFDCAFNGQRLGWLRYFLAPMQDSTFQSEGDAHPTGTGIFVFAGGTAHSFEQFQQNVQETDRDAKKPDFISRLRAYINVKGPNPDHRCDLTRGMLDLDSTYIIRRAFLIRSKLKRDGEQFIPEENWRDPSVEALFNALLLAKRYRHGSRSLETILEMSMQNARLKLNASCLPPYPLLNLHVDADNLREMLKMGEFDLIANALLNDNPGRFPASISEMQKKEFAVYIARLADKNDISLIGRVIFNARKLLDERWRLVVLRTHDVGEYTRGRLSETTQLEAVSNILEQEFGAEIVHIPTQISQSLAFKAADHMIDTLKTRSQGDQDEQ